MLGYAQCCSCKTTQHNGTENQRAVSRSCAFAWNLCRSSSRKRTNRSALLPPLFPECQPHGRVGARRGVWQNRFLEIVGPLIGMVVMSFMRHGVSSAMTSSFSETTTKPTVGTRAHSWASKQSASGHGQCGGGGGRVFQQYLLVDRFPRSVAEPHLHAHDAADEEMGERHSGNTVCWYRGLEGWKAWATAWCQVAIHQCPP